MSKSVAVVIKDKERQYEGLRCSLGLLLEDHAVSMYVLGHEINVSDEFLDNMEFIDEMEGTRYSNVPANVEKYGFEPLDLAAIPKKLKENDIIIAF